MNSIKRLRIVLLVTFCLLITLGTIGFSQEANRNIVIAERSENIFEVNGASIRIASDGKNGVRFPLVMDKAQYNSLTSNGTNRNIVFGTLVIPTDLLYAPLSVNTVNAKNIITFDIDNDLNVWEEITYKGKECMRGMVYIYNVPTESFDRDLSIVGYYKIDGQDCVYTNRIERNLSYVADKAYRDNDRSLEQLQLYMATYNVTLNDNGNITTQQVKYGQHPDLPNGSHAPLGLVFKGWKIEGQDRLYDSSANGEGIKEDTTLVASYFDNEYTELIYGEGVDEFGNYNPSFFTYNQLRTYVGDPQVMYVSEGDDPVYGGYYYMYGSNSSRYLIFYNHALSTTKNDLDNGIVSYQAPCFRSKDLTNWEGAGACAGWYSFVGSKYDWIDWWTADMYAPEVIRNPQDGKYYMYYTAVARTDDPYSLNGLAGTFTQNAIDNPQNRQNIGIAVSDTPIGPFERIKKYNGDNKYVPNIDFKSVAGLSDEYPVIDLSPFLDDNGDLYLYFKQEKIDSGLTKLFGMKMNSFTEPDFSTITILESNNYKNINVDKTISRGLSQLTATPNGTARFSKIGSFIYNEHAFYDKCIEGPQMIKKGSKYYFTYSRWGVLNNEYSVYQSVGDSPLGPFTTDDNPIISGYHMIDGGSTNGKYAIATAHHTFVTCGDETFILYHVNEMAHRFGYVDRVNFVNNKLVANGPSESLQWNAEGISGLKNIANQATITGASGTLSYLTDGVVPFYTYNKDQCVSVSDNGTITLNYNAPKYVNALLIYNAITDSNSFASVRVEITDNNNQKYLIKNLTAKKYDLNNNYRASASTVAEFDEILAQSIKLTFTGKSTIYIPEIVVLGGELTATNKKLNTNYADLCYGENSKKIKIDGVLDDYVWTRQDGVGNTFKNGSIKFKTHYDEYGVYCAVNVTDSNLVYTGSFRSFANAEFPNEPINTSLWLQLYAVQDNKDVSNIRPTETVTFNIDLAGNIFSYGEKVKSAVVYNYNKAAFEFFIDWNQFATLTADKINYRNVTSLLVNPHYMFIDYGDLYEVSCTSLSKRVDMNYSAEGNFYNKCLVGSLNNYISYYDGNYTGAINNEKAEELNEILNGKYVSILGDSISTFEGISSSAANNTNIGNDNAFYHPNGSIPTWRETYWGRLMEKYGLNLLVNNSVGSSRLMDNNGDLISGINRVENLGANTGALNGTKPDVIFIYMGTNDIFGENPVGTLYNGIYSNVHSGSGYITPTTFAEAYVITMEKAKVLYPNAQIYCFTILPFFKQYREVIKDYNSIIKEVVAHYSKTELVDIYAYSGITHDNMSDYASDNLHPNSAGATLISNVLEDSIYNYNKKGESVVYTIKYVTTKGGTPIKVESALGFVGDSIVVESGRFIANDTVYTYNRKEFENTIYNGLEVEVICTEDTTNAMGILTNMTYENGTYFTPKVTSELSYAISNKTSNKFEIVATFNPQDPYAIMGFALSQNGRKVILTIGNNEQTDTMNGNQIGMIYDGVVKYPNSTGRFTLNLGASVYAQDCPTVKMEYDGGEIYFYLKNGENWTKLNNAPLTLEIINAGCDSNFTVGNSLYGGFGSYKQFGGSFTNVVYMQISGEGHWSPDVPL